MSSTPTPTNARAKANGRRLSRAIQTLLVPLAPMGLATTMASFALPASPAHAAITFTCDPTVSASTCATLNTTIAGLYSKTFTNANASIYIKYGATGLGSSTTGFFNTISYSSYLADLAAEGGKGVVRADAITSLPGAEPGLYGGGDISITSALGQALGLTNLNGTTAAGALCIAGTSGCFNGIITITNDPATPLYYRVGAEAPDAYDYYTTVEHEVDEVLGTSSCISTQGPSLSNDCAGAGAVASATDLFRYQAPGSRVLLSTTPGAYFSYDGGVTNGADGNVYNTLSNGDDYADYFGGCPGHQSVQDAQGCPGQDGGLDITNDGRSEINTLDAIGYNLAAGVPEPATWALMLLGFGGLGAAMRRAGTATALI
jgi:hypothetical protein